MDKEFSHIISKWYCQNKRDLPWRNTRDPFKIWLSEIILQQTRVAQGLNYYLNFVDEFDTVHDLAKSKEETILKLWQGLGYYSRARNLHFTANYISNELNGEFPKNFKGLLQLKGVGLYTAAAVASFCYDEKVAVLDGNVFRVLSRVFGIDEPINTSLGERIFRELSAELLPSSEVSNYNQGIMEFGALQCTPKNPKCLSCPLNGKCDALRTKRVKDLPVKLKKTKVLELHMSFLVLITCRETVLRKREGKGVWQNLYEFPSFVASSAENSKNDLDLFVNEVGLDVNRLEFVSARYRHLLSHRKINAQFFVCRVEEIPDLLKTDSVVFEDLLGLPIHRLIEK
ncbi:MAG: A/G-specific adenine glycosylase, partial [Flavobacteriales bacterium]